MAVEDELFQRFGRDFPRGTILFREGEPGHEMYVVQQGKVHISKRVGEVEKILSALGQGEFFGEMSILNDAPRSATATCAEDAKLLVIDPGTFEAMIRSNAEIALRMIKKLADRLREADDQIANLLFRDASTRVVHFLATAAEKGVKMPAGQKVALTPRELPARIGVTAEQCDEVLSKLIKGQVVSVLPDGVLIPDVAKLHHFLEFLQMKEQFGALA